jgi:hypothetical protein
MILMAMFSYYPGHFINNSSELLKNHKKEKCPGAKIQMLQFFPHNSAFGPSIVVVNK